MIRSTINIKVLFILSLIALLPSCSGLHINPPGPDTKAILILPFTEKRSSNLPYVNYYQYEIYKDGEKKPTYEAKFKLPNRNGYLLVDTLLPGTYVVKKITRRSVGTGYVDLVAATYDPIRLDYGKITIFRNSIDFTQKSRTGYSSISDYRVSSVSPQKRAEILEALTRLENFNQWEVLDTDLPPQKSPPLVPDTNVAAWFPKMFIGESWTTREHHIEPHGYRIKHGVVTCTYEVIAVESDGTFEIKKTNDINNSAKIKRFDSKVPWTSMLMGTQYDPRALQFPLYVGKTWETEVEAILWREDHYTFKYKSQYVVEEYATVDTNAGSFGAFRIKADIKYEDVSYWSGQSDFWYAPEAKAIVKSTHTHKRGNRVLIRGHNLLSMDLFI